MSKLRKKTYINDLEMKEERDMERVITSAVKYCTECEKICSNDIIILLGIENELNITMDAGEGMILTED